MCSEQDDPGVLLCLLFDVVTGTRIVTQVNDPGKAVQAVSHSDVEGLSEDTIALLRVGYDLGVAARDVEYDGVLRAGDLSTHFDVWALCES